MAPLVKALIKSGNLTRNCCCGHGKQPATIIMQNDTTFTFKGHPWIKKQDFTIS